MSDDPPNKPAPARDVVGAALAPGVPDTTIDPATGQQRGYVVLSAEERAKGFVRPVRRTYVHVGTPGPRHPLTHLSAHEVERFAGEGYVAFEAYPPSPGSSLRGRYWTQADLDAVGKGCGAQTRMSEPLSETYAREPRFYGSTFCSNCGTHRPVGADGEFVWLEDGARVGT